MKLEYSANKQERAICGLVGVELKDKRIRLRDIELVTLRQAQSICAKAQQMLEAYHRDPDLITEYGEADHAISEILEEHGKT